METILMRSHRIKEETKRRLLNPTLSSLLDSYLYKSKETLQGVSLSPFFFSNFPVTCRDGCLLRKSAASYLS